jgi:superfamily I DNA and/or RNA helicase
MSVNEQLLKTFELIKIERQADLEQYRQKVLLLPLHRKTKEGKCWYPVKIKRDYIGTGERLIIEVERVKELDQPHVFSSGKVVSVFCNAKGTPEKQNAGGVINYVRDNLMVITLNHDDLPDWIDDGNIGVDVMFDENSYREMEATLKLVMKAEDDRVSKLRDVLLGAEKASFKLVSKDPNRYQDTKLNPSQQEALDKIASAEDVAIIHGPPGTGKTTTLVQAIKRTLLTEQQVLVCAASNAAVDLLADKLSDEGLRVLRLGHPARVTEQSLSKTLDAKIASHEYYKDLRAMRKRMEQLRGMSMKYKKDYGHREKAQRKLLMDEVRSLKADADVLEFYIVNDLLQNSDAICCTLVGSSNYLLRGKKYSSVFIDEAAQALEPACWIPILKAERVIFAGDHCQLPPTIKSIDAAKAGLATTLFEKCIEHQPHTAVMLKTQYRMHEDIMHFSSTYFYKNELIAHESVKHATLPDHLPIDFIDTAGCGYNEKQDPETLSRLNAEEATLLIRVVENLVEGIGVATWLEANYKLGIITPYSAQVEYLRKLAEASPILAAIAPLISINTVDAFQGQERDIIAISFVRSNEKAEVGFLADIRRTNVAMTRAKKKLIMIGDSATLGSHPFYLELLDYVQEKGFYRSAFEIEQ